jgi:hypothetical protein
MPDMLEVLSNLSQQNFGSGLADYGKAIKETMQNRSLIEGIGKFQERKEALEDSNSGNVKTTDEVLGEMNKMAENLGKSEYDKTTDQAAKMTGHMLDMLQKMKGQEDLYRPFINSFALLGEDGIKAANALSEDLARKQEMLGKEVKLPVQQLELMNATNTYQMNVMQKNELVDKIKTNRSISEAIDFMLQDEEILNIPAGKHVYYNNPAKAKAYNDMKNRVVNRARKHFENIGIQMDGDDLLAAYKGAIDATDSELQFVYKDEESKDAITKAQEIQAVNDAALQLRQWSAQWEGLTEETKKSVQEFMSTGVMPQKAGTTEGGVDQQWYQDMLEIFGPAGKWWKYENVLRTYDTDGWKWQEGQTVNIMEQIPESALAKLTPEERERFEKRRQTLSGPDQAHTNVRHYKRYPDVIRTNGNNAFLNDNFRYSPKGRKLFAQELINLHSKVADIPTFGPGGTETYDALMGGLNVFSNVPMTRSRIADTWAEGFAGKAKKNYGMTSKQKEEYDALAKEEQKQIKKAIDAIQKQTSDLPGLESLKKKDK